MINIGNSWQNFFDKEQEKDYYNDLRKFLIKEYKDYTVYPEMDNIFNAFRYTPIENVKVVILGQDPYHEPKQAMGLSFSVPDGTPAPPSLLNIKKEIENEGFDVSNWSNDLSNWAKQGVLLLNTCLTVRQHIANSHSGHGWEVLTDNVILELNKQNIPIVFILWGNNARSKKKLLTNSNHLILESAHPSPLSAYRGFFGNNHFKLANEFLAKNNLESIIW